MLRHRNGVDISPSLCLVSVVCPRVRRFARHGVDGPGTAPFGVQLPLFPLRELGIRYELFHDALFYLSSCGQHFNGDGQPPAKGGRVAFRCRHGWVCHAPLDLGDVGLVDAGHVCQLLLRHPRQRSGRRNGVRGRVLYGDTRATQVSPQSRSSGRRIRRRRSTARGWERSVRLLPARRPEA